MPRPDETGSDVRSMKRRRGGRERLLAVAADMFGAHTLAGTSLQMIADRLGITKAAIYHHFSSRDEIVDALMQPVFADVNAGVARIRQLPVDHQSSAARQFYAEFVVTHRKVISMVYFDRGALKPEDSTRVDRLVCRTAQMLTGREDADSLADGEVLVYGVAALVTRRRDLDDQALLTLVRRILGASQIA